MSKKMKRITQAADLAEGIEIQAYINSFSALNSNPDLAFQSVKQGTSWKGPEGTKGILTIVSDKSDSDTIDKAISLFDKSAGRAAKRRKLFEEIVSLFDTATCSNLLIIWKFRGTVYLYHSDSFNINIHSQKFFVLKNHLYDTADPEIETAPSVIHKIDLFDKTRIAVTHSSDSTPSDLRQIFLKKKLTKQAAENINKTINKGLVFVFDSIAVEANNIYGKRLKKLAVSLIGIGLLLIVSSAYFILRQDPELPESPQQSAAAQPMSEEEVHDSDNEISFANAATADEEQIVADQVAATDDEAITEEIITNTDELIPQGTRTVQPATQPKKEIVETKKENTGGDINGQGDDIIVENSPPTVLQKAPIIRDGLSEEDKGIVLLEVTVDVNGNVRDVRIIKSASPNEILKANAIATAKRYKFRPAYEDSKKIVGKARITLKF